MRRTVYSIMVDGTPIDSTLNPILISLSIKQDDSSNVDELTIELDDTDGAVELPRMGAAVSGGIGIEDDSLPADAQGAVVMFEGTMDAAHSGGSTHGKHKHDDSKKGGDGEGPVHSAGSRSKGRTLTLTAKSADMTGKVKQKTSRHMDNATLGDVAKAWGQKAGLSDVRVDASLSSIHRAYWGMANESFMAWGHRTACQIGATFKIYNTIGCFVSRSGGTSASGQALMPIDATWGVNLIEWSASPILARREYGSFTTRYYDLQAAAWKTETASGSGSSVIYAHHTKAPDQDQAKTQSSANKTEGDREKGGADSVTIDGNPDAQAGAMCNISGVRDGVDGTYLISSVTHTLSRSGGYTTKLSLKQPSAGAGTDSRASSSTKAA